MTYIAYSQNLEDVMLKRVFKDCLNGFYVDIGAWHPSDHSVTRAFYDSGWSGINVEPNAYYYDLLESSRRRDVNLKLLVGSHSGVAQFYQIKGAGLSTVNRADAERLKAFGWVNHEVSLPMITLADLFQKYVKHREIDFLKIDVEGHERAVIEGGDWIRFRPKVLVVEAIDSVTMEPRWSDWEPLLISSGYIFAWFDGINRFYVSSENKSLLRFFDRPPNIFDDFQLSAESPFRPRWTTRVKLKVRQVLPDWAFRILFPRR